MPVSKTNNKAVPRKVVAPTPKAVAPRAARPLRNGAGAPDAVAVQAVEDKPGKDKKIKMVRDSLSMPKNEYLVLDELKLRAAKLAVPVKKTELIRAGIKALAALPNAAFVRAVRAVPNLKTGRPPKSE